MTSPNMLQLDINKILHLAMAFRFWRLVTTCSLNRRYKHIFYMSRCLDTNRCNKNFKYNLNITFLSKVLPSYHFTIIIFEHSTVNPTLLYRFIFSSYKSVQTYRLYLLKSLFTYCTLNGRMYSRL